MQTEYDVLSASTIGRIHISMQMTYVLLQNNLAIERGSYVLLQNNPAIEREWFLFFGVASIRDQQSADDKDAHCPGRFRHKWRWFKVTKQSLNENWDISPIDVKLADDSATAIGV